MGYVNDRNYEIGVTKMDKSLLIVTIENCVMAICWTIIACYFNKWWIALFMILCFTDYSHKE